MSVTEEHYRLERGIHVRAMEDLLRDLRYATDLVAELDRALLRERGAGIPLRTAEFLDLHRRARRLYV